MRRNWLLIAVLTSACLVGCDRQEERTPSRAQQETRKPSRAEGDDLNRVAFAIVDGRPLTAAQVRDAVLILARVRKMKRQAVRPTHFVKWANNAAMIAMPGLVSTMLVEDEAKRRGVSATAASDAHVLANYNKMVHGKARNPDELAKLFGELERPFRTQFARESQLNAFFTSIDVPVTEKEIDRFLRTASNRVVQVARYNAAVREKGQKAWEALEKGEAWESVAAKFHEKDLTEDDETDSTRDWYSFRLKECIFDSVATALVGKKAGDYTKPVETEGGLMIVKVKKIEGDLYSCARIFFRMKKDLPLPDRKMAEKIVAKRNSDRRQYELIKELRTQHKVEYPLGTNFVYKIWKEQKKEAK